MRRKRGESRARKWCLMTKDIPFLLHIYGHNQLRPRGPFKPLEAKITHVLKVPGTRPICTYLPGHKEQQWGLLFFGFVLGNDLLSYWLDQLFGRFRLSIILRICDTGGKDKKLWIVNE